MNKIRLKFLGAIDTVTGSCTLMEYNGIRGIHYYLIDAGEYQNEENETRQIRERELEKYAGKIKIIFITHAHVDHIGLLPNLINWGFQGQIYGTKATIELTKIMLEDAMKIAGKNGDEISNAIKKMKFYEFDKNHKEITFNGWGKTFIRLKKDFAVTILRSSHILGSCTWLFRWTEIEYEDKTEFKDKEWRSIYFSGDIGPVRDDIVPNIFFKEYQIPYENPKNKITIIMESTYGNRIRTKYKHQDKITKLAEIIFECVKNGRFVLIPTFALDRAQQVVVDLNYIKHEYSIDGKRWADIKNTDLDNSLYNKKKDDVISLMKNTPPKKQKKRIKKIKDIFNGYSTFQDLPQQKKDELKLFLKTYNCIDINIGIKSPLIGKVNGIYSDLLMDDVYSEKEKKLKFKYLSDEFFEKFNLNKESTSLKDDIKKRLKEWFNCNETGNVVVAASGMCNEGAVLQLLKKHLKKEKTTIILTGYQAENTNGYYLKNYSDGKYEEEDKKCKIELNNINMKLCEIKCKIEDLSEYYSGHADKEQLVNYVVKPNNDPAKLTILLTHGTKEAREELRDALLEKKIKSVHLPEFNKWFDVASEEYDLTEADENIDKIDSVTAPQFLYVNVAGMHCYFPEDFDKDKLAKIQKIMKLCETETHEDIGTIDSGVAQQFTYMNIGEVRLYFPIEFNKDRIKKIIEDIEGILKS